MNLKNIILKKQAELIAKAKKSGVYENFGQKEVSQVSGKHIDLSDYSPDMNYKRNLIQQFSNWCSLYTTANS